MNLYSKTVKKNELIRVRADINGVTLERTDAHEYVASVWLTPAEAIEASVMLRDAADKSAEALSALEKIAKAPTLSELPVERPVPQERAGG